MARAWQLLGSIVALTALSCGRPAAVAPEGKVVGVVRAPPSPSLEELVIHRPMKVGNQHLSRLKLRFLGAAHGPAHELAKDLYVARFGVIERDVLQHDELVVLAWYYDHGYLEVKATHDAEVDGTDAVVTFRLTEGPQYRVKGLWAIEPIEGKYYLPYGWQPPLADGDVFSRIAVVRAVAAVRSAYGNRGYPWVEVEPETTLDRDKHLVRVVIPVVRGNLGFVEEVRIVGNKKVEAKVIEKQLGVKKYDRYDEGALLASKQALLDTGWFERVDVATAKGSNPHRIVVTFDVDEAKAGTWLHVASR